MINPDSDNQKERDRLHSKYSEMGLRGYWQLPRENHEVEPKLWKWKELRPVLMETTDVIRIGPDAFRRNVGLITGSKTISMGFQIVLPGEKAAAHRHANTALRFVVNGGGASTTSNGEPMVMEPGDLLIQPNWVWHDHVNDSDEPIIWIDALDAGVVSFLDASRFRQEWAEGKQQPLTKSGGASRRLYGPVREQSVDYHGAPGVPYHYKWRETLEAMQESADRGSQDPYDGVLLEYKNPITGGHTFLTMTCHIQMLLPGQTTRFHRHTGTTHYHVVQGDGALIVDKHEAKEFTWTEHDSFTLPPWRWHQHKNNSATEPAILFSVTDRPLLQMTGLDREEPG
ncbi:MAG: cupin domain-containing protein [Deltaproteobacteria bacterium]|nr:cupin domain-containing protein [Deltaproteobacteria bacterium]